MSTATNIPKDQVDYPGWTIGLPSDMVYSEGFAITQHLTRG